MEDSTPETAQPPEMTREDLQRLVAEANAGIEPARAQLRDWLDRTPEAWQTVGDLGTHAETAVRDRIAGGDFLHAECLRRSADALRKSLLAEDATAIERLSVQRLVVSWLQLQLADARLAAADGSSPRSSFWIRAAESSQRRFASATSQWQALQKLLGRPVCRAAVAEILAQVNQPSAAATGESMIPPGAVPAESPASAPAKERGVAVPAHVPDTVEKPLSDVVPFRRPRPVSRPIGENRLEPASAIEMS